MIKIQLCHFPQWHAKSANMIPQFLSNLYLQPTFTLIYDGTIS